MHVITAHIIHNFIHVNQGIKNKLCMLYSILELFISDTVTQNYHDKSIYLDIIILYNMSSGWSRKSRDRSNKTLWFWEIHKYCKAKKFVAYVLNFSLNVSVYSMAEINCNTRICFKRFLSTPGFNTVIAQAPKHIGFDI